MTVEIKILIFASLLSPAFAQNEPAPAAAPAGDSAGQAPNAPDPSANRSVLEPRPGGEAIKPKDYSQESGIFHPFTRMGRYVISDQRAVWTSPFHTSRKNLKWWLIFGGATGAFIATDKYVNRNAPDNHILRTLGGDTSYLGEPYTLLPIAAGFYFAGSAYRSDHFRETGLLSFEALADVTLIQVALKSIADRQRPDEPGSTGRFEASSGARYNSGFPSGHAIETFAVASVFAHEYPHKLWLKILLYSYAGGVAGARMAANRHFPGDVLAGGAIGWFVGDYVYAHRHNPDLDKKRSAWSKVMDHVTLGGPSPAAGN
jgi:membrane-associated phospholipid phosphatase